MKPFVFAVSRSSEHTFSKPNEKSINLIKGYGVEGDAHAGKKVKHRFLVGIDPTKPNIRQVHLIHVELLEELQRKGFSVNPGELGENITTQGVDLLSLPTGTKLNIGSEVEIEITALRNPCIQIDWFQKGMLKEVLYKAKDGNLVRKAGVMGVVQKGGKIKPNDEIILKFPSRPHLPLEYVW
jgi:MOSC domain-containing protein YiiM